MTPIVKRFVEIIAKTYLLEDPIVEMGSLLVKGQENLANIRPYFKGKDYIGCDMRKGAGVDRIENVENLTFKDNSVPTIIMLETLEHVQNPIKAVKECYRVLKDNGILIISSLMNFPIHDFPNDYWRFTPSAFKYLLGRFPLKILGQHGENVDLPVNIFGVGFKQKSDRRFKKIYSVINNNINYIAGRIPYRHRFLNNLSHFINVSIVEPHTAFWELRANSSRI